jgi:hypothetical protein
MTDSNDPSLYLPSIFAEREIREERERERERERAKDQKDLQTNHLIKLIVIQLFNLKTMKMVQQTIFDRGPISPNTRNTL